MRGQPKAMTANVLERTQSFLSPLNLHWGAVAALGLLNLYLMIHMGLAWQVARSQDAEAVAQQRVALKTAQIAALPLQGLDAKLRNASVQADQFSLERLPVSYSEVATELGVLLKRTNVHLNGVQYSQSAVDGDAAGQLTQVLMDARLSGDYRSLVLFINGLERDKVFFLISGVSLTGQQTGLVNLRIRIVTYIRGVSSVEEMARYQVPDKDAADSIKPAAPADGEAP
jgi:type IV pilus assembly protein PilO